MERKTNKKSSALPVIILLAVIIAAGVAAFFLLRGEKFLGGRKDITITEAVTTNTNGITDPELGNPDWIELCNPTDAAMDISNYALGVGNEEGGRFIFPSGTTIGLFTLRIAEFQQQENLLQAAILRRRERP